MRPRFLDGKNHRQRCGTTPRGNHARGVRAFGSASHAFVVCRFRVVCRLSRLDKTPTQHHFRPRYAFMLHRNSVTAK